MSEPYLKVLTIDFETRATADIRKTGAFAYAMHPETDVICLALKMEDNPPLIYFPNRPDLSELPLAEVGRLMDRADIIEAHNAQFEYAMWKYCFYPRYGKPGVIPESLPLHSKLRCSAAKAAAMGLPRSLDGACRALGVPQQKDMEGSRLMLKMCKPRKPLKAELEKDPHWNDTLHWVEDTDSLIRLGQYCKQDVTAEHSLSMHTRNLSPKEQALWVRDMEINERGIPVDMESVGIISRAIAKHTDALEDEFRNITGLSSPKQVAQTLSWLKDNGMDLPDLTSDTVSEALKTATGQAKRALEIRRSLSKSSTAKYKAFQDAACADGRVRGGLMFHGAATGRWSGRLVQVQNFPRGTISDVDGCIESFRRGGTDLFYGDVMEAASSCLRGMICAPEGYYFACADYSAIEGRVLAWLAGDEDALNVYRDGRDAYVIAASSIFGKSYDEIKGLVDAGDPAGKKMRQTGKVAELALGYQGGIHALEAMAANYGVTFESEEYMKDIVQKWRGSRPVTTKFWNELETMVVTAVCVKRTNIKCKGAEKVYARSDEQTLNIFLPSGRPLTYMYPKLKMDRTPWGQERPVVYFRGVDSYTNKWMEKDLYGGLIAENITQGTARDIIAGALMGVLTVVFHVHDEMIMLVPDKFTDHEAILKDLVDTMCTLPAWAEGLPLKAEGWTGRRYRK